MLEFCMIAQANNFNCTMHTFWMCAFATNITIHLSYDWRCRLTALHFSTMKKHIVAIAFNKLMLLVIGQHNCILLSFAFWAIKCDGFQMWCDWEQKRQTKMKNKGVVWIEFLIWMTAVMCNLLLLCTTTATLCKS